MSCRGHVLQPLASAKRLENPHANALRGIEKVGAVFGPQVIAYSPEGWPGACVQGALTGQTPEIRDSEPLKR